MELRSEGKPLVQTLVDFFQEVEQEKFETRVLKRLDVIIGMLTAIITADPTAFGFATEKENRMSESNAETQGSAEQVEGDQVVVNEAPEAPEPPDAPEAPEPADPSGGDDDGDADGDTQGGDAEQE